MSDARGAARGDAERRDLVLEAGEGTWELEVIEHLPNMVLVKDAAELRPFDAQGLRAVIDGSGSLDQARTPSDVPSGPTGGGPLDPTVVASLRELGGDSTVARAGIRDLVRTFLDDSGSRFAGLQAAVHDGDAAEVERLAHALIGSSANFGARDVAAGCRELEERAMAGDLADAAMLVARLDEALAVAQAALRAEFLTGGDPLP